MAHTTVIPQPAAANIRPAPDSHIEPTVVVADPKARHIFGMPKACFQHDPYRRPSIFTRAALPRMSAHKNRRGSAERPRAAATSRGNPLAQTPMRPALALRECQLEKRERGVKPPDRVYKA